MRAFLSLPEVQRAHSASILAGKTSLALSLSKLFDCGHTQSDDFLQKKSGPHFIKSVRDLLGTKDIVIADKWAHFPPKSYSSVILTTQSQEQQIGRAHV